MLSGLGEGGRRGIVALASTRITEIRRLPCNHGRVTASSALIYDLYFVLASILRLCWLLLQTIL